VKDGGYLLPSEIEPENSIYVCVEVPDAPEHRQAFAGAVHELTRWWNWQKDEGKNGRLVAAVWWDIYASVVSQLNEQLESCGEECDTVIWGIRTVGCELQVQYEEDGDWTPIGDFSACGATGPEGPAGEDGEDGATGATGPEGPEGESPGEPDSEGGVPDPTAGPGITDLSCAVATGVTDRAVAYLFEWLHQRIISALAADFLVAVGSLLIAGPIGVVSIVIGTVLATWSINDSEAAELELDDDWIEEAKCKLDCLLSSDASITREILDLWGLDMIAYSANSGSKFADMLGGITVSALRSEANLAALTDGSCDDCSCNQYQLEADHSCTIISQTYIDEDTVEIVVQSGRHDSVPNMQLVQVSQVDDSPGGIMNGEFLSWSVSGIYDTLYHYKCTGGNTPGSIPLDTPLRYARWYDIGGPGFVVTAVLHRRPCP
jgi:hypothetical protein